MYFFFLAGAQGIDLRVHEVTFIYEIDQTTALTWRVGTVDQTFFPGDSLDTPVPFGNFSATLTGSASVPGSVFVKLTSTLTIGADFDGTLIECVGAQDSTFSAEITLMISGMMHHQYCSQQT